MTLRALSSSGISSSTPSCRAIFLSAACTFTVPSLGATLLEGTALLAALGALGTASSLATSRLGDRLCTPRCTAPALRGLAAPTLLGRLTAAALLGLLAALLALDGAASASGSSPTDASMRRTAAALLGRRAGWVLRARCLGLGVPLLGRGSSLGRRRSLPR